MNEPSGQLRSVVSRIEHLDALDHVARVVEPLAQRLTQSDAVKRALSGAPLGHRLHPLLTDLPIGWWTAATLTDVFAWRSGERAARRLVGFGVLASLPTAATGLSDWNDTYGPERRVGVTHMAANTAGLLMQVASWRARRRGHHVRGALLGAIGLGAVAAGGYLGGHLVFVQRVGVDREVPVLDEETWHTVCRLDELVDGEPIGATVEGVRIALVQSASAVYALAAVCSHAGGPLDKGRVRDSTLVCPWHGSAFCLSDGTVMRGPATSPQPVYETRIRGDLVEVRPVSVERALVHATV